MDEGELLEDVGSLVRSAGRELVCGRGGHGAGHVCLRVPDGVELRTLRARFSRRYGQLRNLVMGGHTDPKVTERTGLPLLAPFAGELTEMRGWAFGNRWIGCGAVRGGDGEQLVVLVAERMRRRRTSRRRTSSTWLLPAVSRARTTVVRGCGA